MKTHTIQLAVALLAATALVGAQALEAQTPAPAPVQDQAIAITGATIHPISAPAIEGGTIVFEDGVITQMGTNVEIPAGARQVDATGQHIYPGLIHSNSAMGLFEIGGWGVTIDTNELGTVNPNVRAQVAFNPESRHITFPRSQGVLITNSSPTGGLIAGQSAAMMLEGWTWEEMTLQGGTGLVVNWPSTNNENQYDSNLRTLRDTFDEARSYWIARISEHADQMDTDSRWEAMIPVFEGEMPVLVSANELRQIQDAVTWAEEEGVRIVIRGGRDAAFVADHLARKEIPVILTSVQGSPSRGWQPYDETFTLPQRLHEAGVPFAIASGSSAAYTYRLNWEAGTAVAYGLPEDVALRAVTLEPARFLGIDDRVGSLEVGKDATLLLTTGSPIQYETQIEQAYIQGREVDMMDVQRRFYEKYREKSLQRQQAGSGSDR